MKTDLFQLCGHCWLATICWHIECSTFTASSFRIWNSSTGIPSPPLVLFVLMLLKAHLTLHSRMSDCRWVITPSWLSGSLRYFLYSSSLFLPPFLNIFCFCHFHTVSVLYCAHLCMKCSLTISNFLKKYPVFPILLFSSISLHWSLRKAFLSLLAILWNSAFRCLYLSFSPLPSLLFFCQLFVRPPQTTILPFYIFHSLEMVLITASHTTSWTSVHSSSGPLSGLIPWIYLSPPLYNHKGFYLDNNWMV